MANAEAPTRDPGARRKRSDAIVVALPVAFLALSAAVALVVWARHDPTSALRARVPLAAGPDHAAASVGLPKGQLIVGDGARGDTTVAWPQFRGPNRDGLAGAATGLARQWPAGGPRVVWSVTVGEGYAGAAVRHGCVYVMDYDRDHESDALRCLSLTDGRELWRYTYPNPVKRNHGMSRTVPAVSDKYVVAMGPKCHVICVDALSGKLQWGLDLVGQFGATVPDWYAGQCPLIDENLAILAPGGDNALVIAVDCATGNVVWRTPNPRRWRMTHSSIMPMNVAGKRTYVYCGGGGVAGVSADDGALLWQSSDWRIPIATVPSPLVIGENELLLSGGYNAGAMILRLAVGDAGALSAAPAAQLKPSVFGATQHTPILYQGHVYGIRPPKGELVCMDTQGNVLWSSGAGYQFGLGPLLVADGLIYAMDDNGRLVLAAATPGGFEPLAEADVLDGHEAWGPMALAGRYLIVRDFTTMRCLDVGAGPPAAAR
jgi:outer membrane protein assembly factor BamB